MGVRKSVAFGKKNGRSWRNGTGRGASVAGGGESLPGGVTTPSEKAIAVLKGGEP